MRIAGGRDHQLQLSLGRFPRCGFRRQTDSQNGGDVPGLSGGLFSGHLTQFGSTYLPDILRH